MFSPLHFLFTFSPQERANVWILGSVPLAKARPVAISVNNYPGVHMLLPSAEVVFADRARRESGFNRFAVAGQVCLHREDTKEQTETGAAVVPVQIVRLHRPA